MSLFNELFIVVYMEWCCRICLPAAAFLSPHHLKHVHSFLATAKANHEILGFHVKKTCLASLLPTINWEEFIFTSHPNCRSYSTREPIRSNFVFHLSHLEASKLQEDQSMCQNVKQHNHLTVKRFVDSSLLFLTRHQTWPNWCGRRRLLLLPCPVYYYQVGCLVW